MRKPLIAVLAAVALLPACGDAAPAGNTYVSTTVEGRRLVDGTTIRLAFDGDDLEVEAGCNILSGPYRLENGRLSADLGTTQMGCEPAREAQDAWLFHVLNRGVATEIGDDELTLVDDDIRIVFERD